MNPGAVFLAGGFIRACISGETPADIDLFTNLGLQDQVIRDLSPAKSDRPLYVTGNATTIFGYSHPVQVITRWQFDTPESAVESFDFTVARAAIWFDNHDGWQSTCDERFYPDLSSKRLHYCSPIREEEAGGSMLRACKFLRKGYRISPESLAAVMARVVEKYDPTADPDGDISIQRFITSRLREVDPLSVEAQPVG